MKPRSPYMFPESPQVLPWFLTCLLAVVGSLLLASGPAAGAPLEELQAAVQQSPQDTNAWYALGNHYYEQRDYASAEQQYSRAVSLDKNHVRSLFKLGNIVSSQMKLTEIVLPYMKSLSSLSEETVILTALNGWEVICLEKVEPQKLIKLSLERGRSFPLYAGASSKILLAYQNKSYIESFLKKVSLVGFTRNTITDPAQLRKELKTIRKQGYSFSDQEADLGARAIGAPIFDHRGKIVAGLSIAGPRDRINPKNRAKLIRLLKETAQKISGDLGYTGSDESTD